MTIRNYMAEMRYIFAYYNHLNPEQLTQEHIASYINYIKKEHGVGRDKCRMTAQSCSFFFKHILPSPYVVPHALYPRKEFRLPDILTQEQVGQVLGTTSNLKHRAIIALFYGTGIRLSELRFLEMKHISRADMQLKVVAGKGSRDRFTILPAAVLPLLEAYYKVYRPKQYLFEGQTPGRAMNDRSIQHAIRMAMKQAGLEQHAFSAHTLRHSFATHLLDAGTDIHTIKQLLGHSKIETTMIYLHLTKQRREKLVSPLISWDMSAEASFQSLFRHPSIQSFNPYSKAVFADLAACHTAAKGYHLSRCDRQECGNLSHSYHCCGNRHCPNCGTMKRDAWIEDRMHELLPTAYYHMVFTLPHELNPLIMGNRSKLFDALFAAASQTLLKHARMPEYLGAEPGITMVLHTWGQDLSFHPHVHCIVSAGGFDGHRWIEPKRKNNRFLFPEKSMAKMYKAMFMEGLEKDSSITWFGDKNSILKAIRFKKWNVYAKAPFGSPDRVVEYLGRYTHKIAITRHRILEVNATQIRFSYKDYADGSKTKQMWLTHREFIRRFEQHILPKRFVKIRHFGYLRLQGKGERLALIRSKLNMEPEKPKVKIPFQIRMLEKYGRDIFKCPCCETGKMTVVFDTRDRANRKPKPLQMKPAPS